MKRFALILALVLCALSARANSCTTSTTGNWRTTTWASCGGTYPQTGDTAAISGSAVVTIPTSEAEIVGTDGATGTAAITVSGTASLIINGTLDARGDVANQQATTVQINGGGTLTLDSLSGNKYLWKSSGNGGSGNALLNISGTAWTTGNYGTVNGSGGRGGTNGEIVPSDGGDLFGVANFNYALLENLGGSGSTAYSTYEYVSSVADTESHVVWLNCGPIEPNIATGGMSWNAVDIRNPQGSPSLQIADGGSGSPRTLTNLTVYNTNTSNSSFNFNARSFTNISNIILYNTEFVAEFSTVASMTFSNFFFLADTDPNADAPFISLDNAASDIVQNSIFLSHYDNPHYIIEGGAASGSANQYTGNLLDGDGFIGSDSGDAVTSGSGAFSFNFNLNINKAGTLSSMASAGGKATVNNNTSYQSYGFQIGETSGAATQGVSFVNNLISSQADGIHQESAFVSQSGWTVDYTGYYNMTGSNITQPVLGNNSYLAPATYNPYWTSGSFGQNNKGLHDITGNPNFVDATRTVRGYGGWSSVQNVAREMVTINGIDYTGAPTTATAKTVAGILSWVQYGFRPINKIYHNSSSTGGDIGSQPWQASGAAPGLIIR